MLGLYVKIRLLALVDFLLPVSLLQICSEKFPNPVGINVDVVCEVVEKETTTLYPSSADRKSSVS